MITKAQIGKRKVGNRRLAYDPDPGGSMHLDTDVPNKLRLAGELVCTGRTFELNGERVDVVRVAGMGALSLGDTILASTNCRYVPATAPDGTQFHILLDIWADEDDEADRGWRPAITSVVGVMARPDPRDGRTLETKKARQASPPQIFLEHPAIAVIETARRPPTFRVGLPMKPLVPVPQPGSGEPRFLARWWRADILSIAGVGRLKLGKLHRTARGGFVDAHADDGRAFVVHLDGVEDDTADRRGNLPRRTRNALATRVGQHSNGAAA